MHKVFINKILVLNVTESGSKEIEHVDLAYLIKIKIYYKTKSQAKNLVNCIECLKIKYDL